MKEILQNAKIKVEGRGAKDSLEKAFELIDDLLTQHEKATTVLMAQEMLDIVLQEQQESN